MDHYILSHIPPIIMKYFENFIIDNDFRNNIILVGNYGIGKSLLIKNLISNIHINNVYQVDIVDERESKNIISKIRMFVKLKSNNKKIIIIDHSEIITKKMQQQIYQIIINSDNVIVIFICNSLSCIIESIQSNSDILHIPVPSPSSILTILNNYILSNNLSITNNDLLNISTISNGDIRKALMYLNLSNLKSSHSINKSHKKSKSLDIPSTHTNKLNSNKKIEFKNIFNLDLTIDNCYSLLYNCISIDFNIDNKLKIIFDNFTDLKKNIHIINSIINKGFSEIDICHMFIEYLKNIDLNNIKLLKFYDIISDSIYRMSKGFNKKILLNSLLIKLSMINI